jgi:hypothetical protein
MTLSILCPLCLRDDWNHANSCFVMPDGDILTTIRHLSTVAIIDKKTGNIKWRWGVGDISHPHDPTLLDNGNVLVFDNGFHHRFWGQRSIQPLQIIGPGGAGDVWKVGREFLKRAETKVSQ